MNTWQISVQDACVQTLIKQDATLAHLINQIGDLQIQTRPDPLKSLIRSIIGQQITVAVAQSIFQKLSIAIDDHWTVNQLSQLRESEMKALGLSQSKINYIQNVLFAVRNGQLNFEQLYKMDDNSVINALTQIKGIGRWTAEVFLLFTMLDCNVLLNGYIKQPKPKERNNSLSVRNNGRVVLQLVHSIYGKQFIKIYYNTILSMIYQKTIKIRARQ